MNLMIEEFSADNIPTIAHAFEAIGWGDHKPLAQYRRYLAEQERGERKGLVAFIGAQFAGYLTIVWQSEYAPFRKKRIPEIQDFNVLPAYRRTGIGTALMDEAEKRVLLKSNVVGLGVGMYPDYGNAQRLYVKRGYIPDGRGLCYATQQLAPMATTINDDSLVLYFTKKLA